MRGRRAHPKTSRRARELADHYTDDIDSDILANGIHDRMLEDDQLVDLLNLTYQAQDAGDLRETEMHEGRHDDRVRTLEQASDEMFSIARDRADEVVALACLDVLRDETAIREHYDNETVDAAIDEAVEWIESHADTTYRVDEEWTLTVAHAWLDEADEVEQ